MAAPLDIVIIGLSIRSSWGNGHATTYRALVRELVRRGTALGLGLIGLSEDLAVLLVLSASGLPAPSIRPRRAPRRPCDPSTITTASHSCASGVTQAVSSATPCAQYR